MDRVAGTLTLSEPGIPVTVSKIGRTVHHREDIHAGDEIRATIKEVLTVYVASPTGGPNAAVRREYSDARVLVVDPSYRLLSVQYPSGATETFKVGLHSPMRGVEPGDSVAIRPVEVTHLRVRHRANREKPSRSSSSSSASPAR